VYVIRLLGRGKARAAIATTATAAQG
jgi:hypothetical protein